MKTVVFDFGNVLYSFDRTVFFEEITDGTECTASKAKEVVIDSGLENKLSTGDITPDQFYRTAENKMELDINKENFFNAYMSIFSPIPGTLRLVRELKDRYRLQLFSDCNEIHYDGFMAKTPVHPLFDAQTLSFRIGALKTSDRGYQDAIEKASCSPEEIAFIDDIEKYTERAEENGIRGIHFQDPQQLREELGNLDVKV